MALQSLVAEGPGLLTFSSRPNRRNKGVRWVDRREYVVAVVSTGDALALGARGIGILFSRRRSFVDVFSRGEIRRSLRSGNTMIYSQASHVADTRRSSKCPPFPGPKRENHKGDSCGAVGTYFFSDTLFVLSGNENYVAFRHHPRTTKKPQNRKR